MSLRRTVFIVLLAGLAAPSVHGNDSTAELGAGGIVFTKSTDVSMDSEDLWISEDRVRVSYVFTNSGPADVKAEVAFPLPPLPICDERHDDICSSTEMTIVEGDNPMRFRLKVDGKPKDFRTTKQKSEMKNGVGTVSITYHWEQVFPKGQSVRIEHEYVPVVGGSFTDNTGMTKGKFEHEMSTTYCVGPRLMRVLTSHEVGYSTVKYILTTGANWKGPIKTFKLAIAKHVPADKVSVCISDTRKVSPTTFEVVRHDFVPKEDSNILFIPATNDD